MEHCTGQFSMYGRECAKFVASAHFEPFSGVIAIEQVGTWHDVRGLPSFRHSAPVYWCQPKRAVIEGVCFRDNVGPVTPAEAR